MIETLNSLALAGGTDIYERAGSDAPRSYTEAFLRGDDWQPVSSSGLHVGAEGSLGISTAYRCIEIISNNVADTDLETLIKLENGRVDKARNHYAWNLLMHFANPTMTARRWKKQMAVWVLGWGNAYSELEISANGRVTALNPIHPARVYWDDRANLYVVYEETGQRRAVTRDYMLHLRGIETDPASNCGKSVIGLARETMGLALAQEKFGASFFGQGAAMSGFFTFAELMSDDAKKNMRDYIKHEYTGPKNWRKMGILDAGMKFEKLQVDPVDAQFLESRIFSVRDICRWFGMPPHMVADLEGAKYGNLGDQEISFQRHTMRNYYGLFASEINATLFSAYESSTYFVAFDVDPLRQVDPKAQAEVFNVYRQNGVFNANEIRAKLHMNPIPGEDGETYLYNGNMTTTAAQIAAPKTNEKAID